MNDIEQQFRLRRFWGATVFSLGVLWGFSSCVYFPIAALTSVRGSSWLEVIIVLIGGVTILTASVGAFYQRRVASVLLLTVGPLLLLVATAGQMFPRENASGPLNILLLFLSGTFALALGVFGWMTERKGWPALREGR